MNAVGTMGVPYRRYACLVTGLATLTLIKCLVVGLVAVKKTRGASGDLDTRADGSRQRADDRGHRVGVDRASIDDCFVALSSGSRRLASH